MDDDLFDDYYGDLHGDSNNDPLGDPLGDPYSDPYGNRYGRHYGSYYDKYYNNEDQNLYRHLGYGRQAKKSDRPNYNSGSRHRIIWLSLISLLMLVLIGFIIYLCFRHL